MKIKGYYNSGETSRSCPAVLEVTDSFVILTFQSEENQSEKIEFSFSQMKIVSRLGNTPREITFDDDSLFITENNDAIEELSVICGDSNKTSLLHMLESKLSLVLIATVVTIGFITSFVIYGIPASAKYIAYKMPATMSENFGSSLAILDNSVFDPSALELDRKQEILDLVEPYIESHSELHPVLFFRSGMGANALALPGGEIVFTDDFVNLAENDDELLAVFFHELGHLKNKHLARRVLQDSMITLMVVLISGDIDTIDLVTGLPALIVDLSYSREFEIEADQYALELMYKENIPLENFSTIMLRFEELYNGNESNVKNDNSASPTTIKIKDFLSTHPATEDRVQLSRDFIKKYQNQKED